jgi:hypothetical protein
MSLLRVLINIDLDIAIIMSALPVRSGGLSDFGSITLRRDEIIIVNIKVELVKPRRGDIIFCVLNLITLDFNPGVMFQSTNYLPYLPLFITHPTN